VADDDLVALTDDSTIAGLLDDDPTAFGSLTPLVAKILDPDT
jgi:hypothetical protein